MKIKKLGMFAVGGWLGYVISLILYSAFLYKIETNPPEVIILNIKVGIVRDKCWNDNCNGLHWNLFVGPHCYFGY
jgi:hypothetical protein